MKAVHLQTEYLTEPLGIDIVKPRLYWNCEGSVKQTAYQIVALRDGETVWDSGKVESSSMTHIQYEGKPLKSRDRVEWTVTLWDENGVSDEASSSWFELGLLSPSDWRASWISGSYKPEKNHRYPADCFRKSFKLTKEIKRARLYATACGLYEVKLNGARVGNFVLAPGCTDYRKRVQYQTYDVTELLRNGENTLDITLGDGWFRGSVGCFGSTNVYGRRTSVIAQLEITYADGSTGLVLSDDSWRWSNDGPIRFNDLKDGEIFNAAMMPSYSGLAQTVEETRHLVASNNVQPREQESFSAKLLITPSGKKVLDFGQNIAGFLSFTVNGKKGQSIRLLLGETLDEHGEFTQANFQSRKPMKEFGKTTQILLTVGMGKKLKGTQPTPRQEIRFTGSGGEDHYKTCFAVFGFRYALIETDADFDPADFRAIAVYSDLEQTGAFSCSNEKVNRLYRNTVWSMKGNFLDIPTDCPTRERLGWTGDAQVFFNTSAYLMGVAPFFRKWMQDMADGMLKNGVVPAVVPYVSFEIMYNNTAASVGWGDAAVYLPYRYWKRYGDRRILEQFYYAIARPYSIFAISHTGFSDKKKAKADPNSKYIYERGRHLGEWLEPTEFRDEISAKNQEKQTEVATAYFHYSMKLMAEMARELGENADERLFADYAKGSRKAYKDLFWENGVPDTDRQAKLVRPLALGLADGELKAALESRLAKAVENHSYRIGTGFLSTPFILPVLTEAGRSDLAYKMLECEESPSWLGEVSRGATTVWETWEGYTGDSGSGSLNHYSPGAVCQWLFETCLGIRPDGENRFIVTPVTGGTLTHAEGSYMSLYGEITVSWEKTESGVKYRVTVPANCVAEVRLPGRPAETVTAGVYEWEA